MKFLIIVKNANQTVFKLIIQTKFFFAMSFWEIILQVHISV